MERNRDIDELMERYFEGETTLEEERTLEAIFASGEVPKEYAHLGALFAHNRDERKVQRPEAHKRSKSRPLNRKRWSLVGGTLAAAVVLLGVFLRVEPATYAEINGQRVDDVEIVMATIAPHLEHISMVTTKANGAFEAAKRAKETTTDALQKIEKINLIKQITQ